MKTAQHTLGIVLSRTNYGEADRIVNFITLDFGKVQVIAKGVRKEKSKLAGGIEPFCVSEIGFIQSRGALSTLVSSRLKTHYGGVVGDLDAVEFSYDCLKKINKLTETVQDQAFFKLLQYLFDALDKHVPLSIVKVWWYVQIAEVTGHGINVERQVGGESFQDSTQYIFNAEKDGFEPVPDGLFNPEHIKFLRLAKSHTPQLLKNVTGGTNLATDLTPLMQSFAETRV
jgi:DNA repair protein RecO (recombination protein O)